MFSFLMPWAAILLPLPLLIRRYWPRPHGATDAYTHGDNSTLLHPALGRLASTFVAARSLTHAGSSLQLVMQSLLWVALVTTLMQPQWLEPYTEIRTEGYDLMLAVDTSRSMEALDFTVDGRQVTRMAVIKGVLGRFIKARDGDRIGIVVFGSQAFVLSPMTLDLQALGNMVDGIVTRMAGNGTAIGDAIGLGVKKLRERPEGSRVLILVTDGKNTDGSMPPELAAKLAAHEGIRIYTIGVGSKGLVPFFEDGQMTQVKMEIDEALLTEVADTTGGAYFRATDTGALDKIYQQIDALEKTQAESRSVMIARPLYRWPLGLALLLLFLLGLFPNGIPRAWFAGRAHG
ncbi:MAG TPA: VWA domain-containing protein [Gammaproteobacteria bacterium]|nr:VWA domain-containing protein [Gammaproteobacteria bacterium]